MEWFTMVAPAHSDIVPSRRFTLFPFFDCLASGRQPAALFGQPNLEFKTGGISHGGGFLGWHADTVEPFSDRHGQTFRLSCPCLRLNLLLVCQLVWHLQTLMTKLNTQGDFQWSIWTLQNPMLSCSNIARQSIHMVCFLLNNCVGCSCKFEDNCPIWATWQTYTRC